VVVTVLPLMSMVQQAGAAQVPMAALAASRQPGSAGAAAAHVRRPVTLAQRRAQVRQGTSAADVLALARGAAARNSRKHSGPKGAQARGLAAKEHALALALARQHTAAGRLRVLRAGYAAQVAIPDASTIDPVMGGLAVTGPDGFIAGNCDPFTQAGCATGQIVGDVFPGEQLSVSVEVVNDDSSGAAHQVRVSWNVICAAAGSPQFGVQTVSAPSDFSSSFTPVIVSASVPVADLPPCASSSAAEGGNTTLVAGAVVTDVSNGGAALDTGDVWDVSVPPGQMYGCGCGPDSVGGASAQAFAGDPVSTATGEYAETVTDSAVKAPGYPFALTRTYSSNLTASGSLGPGWTVPWQISLAAQSSGNVVFTSENGSQFSYAANGSGGFSVPVGARSVLTATSSGGYVLTAPDHHTLAFNSAGQLTAEDDATGRGLSFVYTGSQVTSITDAAGHVVTLSYTGSLLTQVTLPGGHTIAYGYTGGLLTSATVPGGTSGETTTYAYTAAGLLASVKDPDGHFAVRNTYNASGQVTSQQDGTGATTAFSYTTVNGLNETDVTDPDGGIQTYLYGGNMLIESVDPMGNKTLHVYNQFLQPTEVTDPLGNTTTMAYDGKGNLTARANPLGNEQQWAYDASNNVTSYTNAALAATTYAYNAMDEVTSVTAPGQRITTYAFDSAGNLASSTDPRGNVSGANRPPIRRPMPTTVPGSWRQ